MGGKTLTRADLAEAVVEKVGLPRNESQDLVERVLEEISGSLAEGQTVKLSSFGSFGIRQKGQRIGRKDTGFKRFQSRVANKVRGGILKDGTRDTGCGLKCFRREAYLSLPYFDAIHRFMPALMVREGYRVVHVDVIDRPRLTGVSNYGFFNRLWVGIVDLAGVWWLIRRKKPTPVATEVSNVRD